MKVTITAALTFAMLTLSLQGCFMGEEEATTEYSVEIGELAVEPGKTAKTAGYKVLSARKLRVMKMLHWSSNGVANDVTVSTCSDSMLLKSICAGTNGKKGSVSFPGPDGGTCFIHGTYQNCTVSDGCCTCDLVEGHRSGDCKEDGSETSIKQTQTATW